MAIASNKQSGRLSDIVNAYHTASKRLLLLDYDGTLVFFTRRPELAKPTQKTLSIIKKLAADAHNTIVIISGRDKGVLDAWLGHLPLQFVAEHGAFERLGGAWQNTNSLDTAWKEKIRPIVQPYIQILPGSLLEEKETALVYHYRDALNQTRAENIAGKLIKKLRPLVTELGLHATHAGMAIEIRTSGTDKGQAALGALAQGNYDFVMCAGDSATDEDMFRQLARQAFCIKVGTGTTAAAYRLKNPEAFIDLLTSFAEVRE